MDLARPSSFGEAIVACWGDSAQHPALAVPPGATTTLYGLIHLAVRAVDDRRVTVQVFGWERDLTHHLGEPVEVEDDQLPALLERVKSTLGELIPAEYLASWRDQAPVVAGPGGEPRVPIDLDGIARLMRTVWPAVEVQRPVDRWGDGSVEARPFGTSRVSLQMERRGGVAGLVWLGPVTHIRLFGHSLVATPDEVAVLHMLELIDQWLRLSLPSADVLADPILEG
jgi:hypothetical protein